MTATTTAQRQATRRAQLHEIARSLGYPTWYKLTTGMLRGEVRIVRVEPQEERKVATLTAERIAQLLDDTSPA